MVSNLLEVENLCVDFSTQSGAVHAVRSVSFAIGSGETVGLVGESGSGKSVTSLSIMRLLAMPPGKITSGAIRFEGNDLLKLSPRDMQKMRGKQISMVFQDPFSCLNPTMTLGEQVVEAICAHSPISKLQARNQALELFRAVRIPEPEIRMRQYPHQISGGQRQRVMIAIAFCTQPKLLIADEPTTALDVTVQAQIMALMQEFQQKSNAAILLITHDLGVVAEMCNRVLVMYAGEIVEEGTVEQVFHNAKHPYTIGLLESLPKLNAEKSERLKSIPGQPPDLAHLGPGCAFAERCSHTMDICRTHNPGSTKIGDGQTARCHLFGSKSE